MIVILGPTASGKTRLAAQVAAALSGEVISADSRQVYRRMDIGTGKDRAEYMVGEIEVPVHLMDILEPGDRYNINSFYEDFEKAFDSISARGKLPILCGGSGLYLQTAMEGNPLSSIPVNEELRARLITFDKALLTDMWDGLSDYVRERTDSSTVKRLIRAIEIDSWLRDHPIPVHEPIVSEKMVFGLDQDKNKRWDSIGERLLKRFDEGLLDEVQSLLDEGLTSDQLRYYGLEYLWCTDFLVGKISRERLEAGLETAIRQFAKRQMTWFRKMERDGLEVNWISPKMSEEEKVRFVVEKWLNRAPREE